MGGKNFKKVWSVYSLWYYGAYTSSLLPSPLEGEGARMRGVAEQVNWMRFPLCVIPDLIRNLVFPPTVLARNEDGGLTS